MARPGNHGGKVKGCGGGCGGDCACIPAPPEQDATDSILLEAHSLVYGDRNVQYGHPADDYGRTAALWTAILGTPVTARQAALCMVAVKISREVNRPSRDNRVDGAGYFAVVDRITRREAGLE